MGTNHRSLFSPLSALGIDWIEHGRPPRVERRRAGGTCEERSWPRIAATFRLRSGSEFTAPQCVIRTLRATVGQCVGRTPSFRDFGLATRGRSAADESAGVPQLAGRGKTRRPRVEIFSIDRART